ncbi:putative bifunctional diguanylate cyclase/phosphodiesterase [Geodermatophilus sp. SYSU D00758]
MGSPAALPARPRGTTAVLALLGVLAVAAVLLAAVAPTSGLVPLCVAAGALAAAAVLDRTGAGMPGRRGLPWRLLALGGVLLAGGQVLAAAGTPPVLGGLLALAGVPAPVVAVALLLPRRRRGLGSRVALDGAVLTVAVVLIGSLLLADVLATVDQLPRGVVASYPFLGAVLCGVGLVAVTAVAPPRRRAAGWVLAGCTAMAAAATADALASAGAAPAALPAVLWLAMLAATVAGSAADPPRPPAVGRDVAVPLRGVVVAEGLAHAALLLLVLHALAGRLPAPHEAAAAALLVVLSALRAALWAADNRRVTRRLQRTESYFRALLDSGDAVTVVLDEGGRVGWVSGPVEDQLGWTEPDLAARALEALLHPGDRGLVRRVRAAVAAGAPVPGLPATVRLRSRSGRWRDLEVSGAAPAGRGDGVVLHLRDVSDRRSTQRELERLAFTDFLTGLPNRARFMAALEEAVLRPDPGCLLLVDLDGFKTVNDVAGHDAGDRLLAAVADQLRSAAREDDVVARLGGDEFALLVPADREEAAGLAERLVLVLDQAHRPTAPDGSPQPGPVFPVSGSVGLAEIVPGDDPTEAVRRADLALRTAKAAGKNCVRTSGEALDRAVSRRARLAQDLPGAIEGGRLGLVFQPVVGVHERRVLGVEALVRWQHPVLGAVPADELVSLAEDDGLVVALERWVLGAATAVVAPLLAAGRDLQLGVNVSVRHLQAGCLVADVAHALAASGLPPHRLMLEITESALMGGDDRIDGDIAALRELGCVLSLDDFGKGYSTLARLARVPVDVLKMDRAFVAHIEADPRTRALVAGVVDLGRTLGMDVVAEGVETPGQLAALRSLGCRFLQGWLLARPVPAAELPAVLDGFAAAVLDAAVLDPAVPAPGFRPTHEGPGVQLVGRGG